MPKRANVMYLGYEVQLSSHLAFGEPILFGIVTHKYINKDGAKTQEVEMHRLADLDCSKWNSAIGTFS